MFTFAWMARRVTRVAADEVCETTDGLQPIGSAHGLVGAAQRPDRDTPFCLVGLQLACILSCSKFP